MKATGTERVFIEYALGARWDRPELHKMLDQLRAGDVVVVRKLDWLIGQSQEELTGGGIIHCTSW